MAFDYKKLKQNGIIRQADGDYFCLRLRSVGGNITTTSLAAIGRIAENYGEGTVHLTSRQGVEIPFVHQDQLDNALAAIQEAGLVTASCGPRVRTVTACQGTRVCRHGLIDTKSLAERIATHFNGAEAPHKFKIGVTGCPNNCLKAEENDVGIKGNAIVEWLEADCIQCGICKPICPVNAIDLTEGRITIDTERCIGCGGCAKLCPQKSFTLQTGYRISFGGLFGRQIATGTVLKPFVKSPDDVIQVITRALQFYRLYGKKGERFGKALQRVGINKLQEFLQDEQVELEQNRSVAL